MANFAVLVGFFTATLLFGVLAELVCKDGETLNTCAPEDYCAKYVDNCPTSEDTPTSCPTSNPCISRCQCSFAQRRNANGTCIPAEQCTPFKCRGPNESFRGTQRCEKCSYIRKNGECSAAAVGHILIVVPPLPGCYCIDGYYRNACGICVPKAQCENQQTSQVETEEE